MKQLPGVTVIVPVRDAEATLEACLQALLSQEYPGAVELIVADNLSRDGSPDILKRYEPKLRTLTESTPGPGAVRNAAVRCASHGYLAFTDADCIPEQGWIRELVRCAQSHPQADFVGGRIAAVNPQAPLERFAERIYDQQDGIEKFTPPYAVTANLLMRRQKLIEFGLFDESFQRGGDSELSFRAHFHHQAEFIYAGQAIVRHHNVATVKDLFWKGLQHGAAAAHLWKSYSRQLNRTRWRRCLDQRPALRLAGQGLRSLLSRGRALDTSQKFALYDALFSTAKQVGFLAGTLRHP